MLVANWLLTNRDITLNTNRLGFEWGSRGRRFNSCHPDQRKTACMLDYQSLSGFFIIRKPSP